MVAVERAAGAPGVTCDELAFCDALEVNDSAVQVVWNVGPNSELITFRSSRTNMLLKLPIETDRLRIRRYTDKDLSDILEYSTDADFWLARNLDWPATENGVKSYWEAQRAGESAHDPKWLSLVVELKAAEKVIGHVGIGVIHSGEDRQGMIGWLLGRAYQRQGLATEAARALISAAFTGLELHRITARTGRDNHRSWYLMERLGMRREAHFRESHIVRGERRDEFIYAVLASEWKLHEG